MIHIGTSGYSYREWRGSFYPDGLPASQMLRYYAGRFSTVEINNTFYRLPSEKVLAEWANQTPPGFAFTLKASRRITHEARLRDCDELMGVFSARAQTLGPKLGVLLFQLPSAWATCRARPLRSHGGLWRSGWRSASCWRVVSRRALLYAG
jgi:uncharacterized protein YecE (DUF72 family)